MQKYNIKILSEIDNQISTYLTTGQLKKEIDGFLLCYQQDNHEVLLEISDKVHMMKKGEESLELFFEKEKYTQGNLQIKENTGYFSIYTEKISYKCTQLGVLLILEYQLIFPSHKQKTKIRLTAKKI